MSAWLKKYWGLLVAGLVVIAGLIVAILVPWRRPKPVVPERPTTPDVVIPKVEPIHTTPADDYDRTKTKPADVDDVATSINGRYK
jgi:hypothetical protein